MTLVRQQYVAAIDPGLDDTGVAVFKLPAEVPCTFEAAVHNVEQVYVFRTEARTRPPGLLPAQLGALVPLADRLRFLVHRLVAVDHTYPVVRWFIECPTTGGVYHARRSRQRTKGGLNAEDLSKLFMVIGALAGALATRTSEATFVPPPRMDKKLRAQAVLPLLEGRSDIGLNLKRPSPDALDAIFLGAVSLTTGRYTAALQRRP